MRAWSTVVACCLLIAMASLPMPAKAQQAGWKTYTSQDGNYSVMLPTSWTLQETTRSSFQLTLPNRTIPVLRLKFVGDAKGYPYVQLRSSPPANPPNEDNIKGNYERRLKNPFGTIVANEYLRGSDAIRYYIIESNPQLGSMSLHAGLYTTALEIETDGFCPEACPPFAEIFKRIVMSLRVTLPVQAIPPSTPAPVVVVNPPPPVTFGPCNSPASLCGILVVLTSDPPGAAVYWHGGYIGIAQGLPPGQTSLQQSISCKCSSSAESFTFKRRGYKDTTENVTLRYCGGTPGDLREAAANNCWTHVHAVLSTE